ncbi:hypothetical protein RND71_001410 [Anisodus tanguticus]|uniref:Uncharacterized protein n=1 Tax=Anisodus tanguticus TaxID=243964 RepID=A0AAE1T1E7_9SOLA|nr:hypothetical protein RND71_001410 [Anisodus tanguticus]
MRTADHACDVAGHVYEPQKRTTNAPKDSELPEVDTTKEIVRKRKKEEIALRFADPGSKELYLAGLEIKREGNLAWVIHEEKRMSWNGLKNECPVIIQNLKASRWACLVKPTGNYIPVIVREFYATYGEILNSKRGRKEIEDDDDFFLMYTDYDERMKSPDDHRVWTTSVIAKETLDWIDTMVAIHKNTLKKEKAGVPWIDRYKESIKMVDYTRLEYGKERKTTVPQSQATMIILDTQLLGAVDQHVPTSTSVLEVQPRLRRLLLPHLWPLLLPQMRGKAFLPMAIEDDDDNRSERQSDSELDIDKGDDPLASAHSTGPDNPLLAPDVPLISVIPPVALSMVPQIDAFVVPSCAPTQVPQLMFQPVPPLTAPPQTVGLVGPSSVPPSPPMFP